MRKIFIMMLIAASNGTFAEYCTEEVVANLRVLANANAENDAHKEVKKDNPVFLAIYGFSYSFPGMSQTLTNQIEKNHRFKVIEGTGDNFCAIPHFQGDQEQKIFEYAATFNKIIAIRVGLNKPE